VIAPRLLIAGICLPFLFSGIAKLLDFDGAVAEFAHFGFSVPALFAALTIALQLGGSAAAIALGSRPAVVAALALAAFTVAATVLAHSHQPVILVEHLSIAFALGFVAWWSWRPRERRPS
jgi:uncharacterized membrane protein YphA (DoxX/SURF4 family)